MCHKEIDVSYSAHAKVMEPCDTTEKIYSLHSNGCKRRTLIQKHSKSLKSGYRKYYQKMTWSVFCQISFFFQVTILTQFVLLNLVSLVDAIEQYNRLSISDKSLTTIQRDSDLDVNAFNDFRHVSHDELLRIGDGFDSFTDPGVTHFSEILFDFNHYQVCCSKPSCQKIYI